MKALFSFLISFLFLGILYAETIDVAMKALNAGQLRTAQGVFLKIAENPAESSLNRAIAYKNLGTSLSRMGLPSKDAFDSSERFFQEELQKTKSPEVQEQYGYLLYQRANCLLTECEIKLNSAKLQGIPAIPFQFLKDYLGPATEYLRQAQSYYPSKRCGDLTLLKLDLLLCETHLWQSCHQDDSARRSLEKALGLANESLEAPSLELDTRKKLLLRKAMLLCDSSAVSPVVISKTLSDAIKINSGNVELDIAVFTFYAKYSLNNDPSFSSAKYADLEKQIQEATAKIECLRKQNLKNMDFVSKKNYFATRTELYEVLLMLYAKQNRPFDMLLAINQIRSRAIQDEINTDTIKDQQQLQKILAENQGMLLAYYVGSGHVWMVRVTGNDADIACSKITGQELTAKCWNVIQVYSDIRHAQTYLRYGPQYKVVPEAFEMSRIIYDEIFKSPHLNFKKNSLKHLYIIPHNVLNYLPFSALAVETNAENVFKTRFVAEDNIPISYLTSINSLLTSAAPVPANQNNVVFARGDYSFPAFYNNDPENPDNPSAPPLPLPNVSVEGKNVAKLLNVSSENIFLERDASEFNLMQKTKKICSVVHIASHAHLNAFSPQESYVVLAAGHDCDGKVKVCELLSKYRGKMCVDLLVLSACDTNRGENRIAAGDDIAALSNAFLVAGTKNVIATEWPASDTSFPQIMEFFYSDLAKGIPKDIALANAIKNFLSQDQTIFRYPIFWGNIVLTGKKQ